MGGGRVGGGSGWGVRVDVNREVKVLLKFKKKIEGGGVRSGGGSAGGGSGWMSSQVKFYSALNLNKES